MMGLLAGHCHLKGHLFKMGLMNSPVCERRLKKINHSHRSYVIVSL
jgi:hypothetical protein